MTLSRTDVEHVAELAKLALSDQEKETFGEQLSAILDHFEHLQQLDLGTAGPPTMGAGAVTPANVLRDDEPRPSLPLPDVLANAPAVEADCFRVPPVLGERLGGRG